MKRSRGFTLVELLVVIGIIAVLISVLLPSLNKARASASALQCANNMRQVGYAFQMYAGENGGLIAPAFMVWDSFWKISYDDVLAKHLGVRYGSSNDPNNYDLYGPYPGDQTGLGKMIKPPRVLRCPEDNREGFVPNFVKPGLGDVVKRSYSMVRNEWGINGYTVAWGTGETFYYTTDRTSAIRQTGTFHDNRVPLKFARIRDSAQRLLLVENFVNNICGNDLNAAVNCPADCVPNYGSPAHPARTNNFLMADGHVERMHFEDTYPLGVAGGARPAQGMWRRSGL